MANSEHLKILKQNVEYWNAWRILHPTEKPDFSQGNLAGTNLKEAELSGADLKLADLNGVNLERADLTKADLRFADLTCANLSKSVLFNAKLKDASFHKANLINADLRLANLDGTRLCGANFHEADLGLTILINSDLSGVKGLHNCKHHGPCFLDTNTLLFSRNLPDVFLRGCGLPDNLIAYLPSLRQGLPIQFYSCFISHSTKDSDFTKRLYNDLQGNGVRCWYAPEEMKGGEKLYDQIDSAILIHDKLLLVLSEHSLKSEWVVTEIRRCRKAEKREGKRKLFPIRLVDYEAIKEWECFDADSGKDLAIEVREFFLPDFSHWKDHDAYKKAFTGLLRDLKESAEEDSGPQIS